MENIIKKYKKEYIFIPIIILLSFSLIIVMIFSQQSKLQKIDNEKIQDYHHIVYHQDSYMFNTSIVSILLLGIDKDNSDINSMGQSDAMGLLLLDRENKKISFITIPRETMSEIEMFDVQGNSLGYQTSFINLAYAYGKDKNNGCMLSSRAVSRLFNNIPVIHYAAIDLSSLSMIHQIVGTLEVMIPNDSLQDIDKNWTKGKTIILTNENVESFIRTRDAKKDFTSQTRLERQEVYIKSFYEKIHQLLLEDRDDVINHLYDIVKNQKMTTNITYNDLVDFCQMMIDFQFDKTNNFYTLAGHYESGDVHNTFYADQDKLDQLVIKLFYKKEMK